MAILCRVDRAKSFGQRITVASSGRTLHCARGNEMVVRLAIFDEAGAVLDLTDHASLNLAYMPATRTGDAVASKTAAIHDDTFTLAQYLAGTHYHAEFTFDEADMNPSLGSALSVEYWLVAFGIKTTGGGEVTHGGGVLIVEEDGTANTVDTPDPPAVGITAAQAAALIEASALLQDASVASTGIQEFLGLNLTDPTELTISAGAITVTQGLHTVDTEADAASDDLDTITAAKGVGDILMLVPASDARTVVLKHATGNIHTFNGTDITLDTDDHWAILVRVGSRWLAMANVATGAASDHGTLSGLADDDHTQYLLAAATRASTGIQEFLGLNLTDPTELTISAGAVTATQGLHAIDTEADAASDDLDTVTAAKGVGDLLIILPAHTDRTVVLKHGTGNLYTASGADLTLDTINHAALLVKAGTNWLVFGNAGGGVSDHGALSGLADDDHTQYLRADATRAGTGMQEVLGLNFAAPAEMTIASGAVTATQSLHTIDTEGDASSDDLATITAAKGIGDLLILVPAHTDRTVVLKHGTGNIRTASAADITLDNTDKGVMLVRVGSNWVVWGNVSAASFDPASPGAIGGTTPAAITCTTLTTGSTVNLGSGAAINGASYINFNLSSVNKLGIGGSGIYIYGNLDLPYGGLYIQFETARLLNPASNTFQQGANASTPSAQTYKAPDATGTNVKGGNMKVAGGAGSGTGAQGDVELEGDIVTLDAGTRIDCDAPVGLKSYTYSTTPAPSPAGQLIRISNASSDSSSPLAYDSALALSDGSYFRYVADNSIVGDV